MQLNKIVSIYLTIIIFSFGFSGLSNLFFDNAKFFMLPFTFLIPLGIGNNQLTDKFSDIKFSALDITYIVIIISYLFCFDFNTCISLFIGLCSSLCLLNNKVIQNLVCEYFYKTGMLLVYAGLIQFIAFIVSPELIPTDKTNYSSSTGGAKISVSTIEYLGFVSDYTTSLGFSYRRLMGYSTEPSAYGYILLPLLYMSLFKYKNKISTFATIFYISICVQSVLIIFSMILCLSAAFIFYKIRTELSILMSVVFISISLYCLYFVNVDFLYEKFLSLNDLFNGEFSIFLKKFDSFHERLNDIRGVYDINSESCFESMGGAIQGITNRLPFFGYLLGFFCFFYLTNFLLNRKTEKYKIGYVYFILFIILFFNSYGWITPSGFITLSLMYIDSLKNNDNIRR